MLHQREILQALRSRLDVAGWRVCPVSLVCTQEALRARLEGDVRAGLREADIVERSLGYLPLYRELPTWKLDVSMLTPEETAAQIAGHETECWKG